MRNYVMAALIALVSLSMHSQNQPNNTVSVTKGDVIEIGNPSNTKYKYIKLPRANFVITRNGVANYKAALGKEVVVTEVKAIKDGHTRITVKRKDGKKFFNTTPTISISLEKALAVNEIKLL
ncbi:hypothetical protein [Confluentibacter lentus]|uniref:hypothetical protein n=1 Tax=Confluentibacter lentus TaxID=1699412 RepID=UPI000C2818E4|nr:hypothetical protein [Confluentibacter lentus]